MAQGFRTAVRIKGTKLYVKQPRSLKAQYNAPFTFDDSDTSSAYESGSLRSRVTKWRPSAGGPNSTINSSLDTMRTRSRNALRNDGLAGNLLEALVGNIIGSGIKPQFVTPDANLNKTLSELFLEWTDLADADERLDFYGLQALAFMSMLEGGDSFVRFRMRRPQDNLKIPFQLQLLEAEFCPTYLSRNNGNNGWIQNGVEFDLLGKRQAFWMYRQHPYDAGPSPTGIGLPLRVPASEVCQLMTMRRPGAVRGVPHLNRVLLKINDLNEYDDFQLVRQKVAALFAGFVSTGGELDDAGVFPGQEASDQDGADLAPMEPGVMQILQPGEEINFSQPPSPGSEYVGYMRHQERRVAAGAGVLYEQATGDYSMVNDRTWRSAMADFKRRCGRAQFDFVFQMCRPTMVRWLQTVAVSGIAKQSFVPEEIKVKWLPQAWEYINPVQDIEALVMQIRSGLTSRSQIVSERGYDAEVVDKENAEDYARQDSLGLIYDTDPRQAAKAAINPSIGRSESTNVPGIPGKKPEADPNQPPTDKPAGLPGE